MKKLMYLFAVFLFMITMPGCRNNTVSSPPDTDVSSETAANIDINPTTEATKANEYNHTVDYPKEFDDSCYTDLYKLKTNIKI